MELANIKKKPQLNDFRHLDEFNDLALNKLTGDLAFIGISGKVVKFIARHKLCCHPEKYLPAGASEASFEGCLLLLNDAVQNDIFTLDNLTTMKEFFTQQKENKAKKVVEAFEKELAQSK